MMLLLKSNMQFLSLSDLKVQFVEFGLIYVVSQFMFLIILHCHISKEAGADNPAYLTVHFVFRVTVAVLK